MNKQKINEIFTRFRENKATPRIELEYTSAYTLLVAVVLSAQATDKGVNRATPALFEVADTPEKMVELGEEGLKSYVKTIGLFNSKSKNIIALSKMLIENYKSEVPDTLEELIKLPGVGRKSANVVLNSIWGKKTMPVDTHILRISNRIGLCKTGKDPYKTELALMKCIPDEFLTYAHHWLVLHGRYVCKARKPECGKCIINDLCEYKDKTA